MKIKHHQLQELLHSWELNGIWGVFKHTCSALMGSWATGSHGETPVSHRNNEFLQSIMRQLMWGIRKWGIQGSNWHHFVQNRIFRLRLLYLFIVISPLILSLPHCNPAVLSESAGCVSPLLLIILNQESLSPFSSHAAFVSLQETHKMGKNETCV